MMRGGKDCSLKTFIMNSSLCSLPVKEDEKRNRQCQFSEEVLADCTREAEINFHAFNSELQGMGHHCEPNFMLF